MGLFKKIKIGNLLLKKQIITKEQLDAALKIQKEYGGKLGNILIHEGFVKESDLLHLLSEQLKVDFINLEEHDLKRDIATKLPEKIARRYKAIPLEYDGSNYIVGMADPTDVQAIDEIQNKLKKKIIPVLVSEIALLNLLNIVYRRTEEIVSYADELKRELGTAVVVAPEEQYETLGGESAPVAKLLDSIFSDAVQTGASDVHIEPAEKGKFLIRLRVDGILQESEFHGKEIISALILRIKLMSRLDISEKRLPQDGRMRIQIQDRDIDVRVSTVPTKNGESVVMRLLDQSAGLLRLEDIGFTSKVLKRVEYLITRPNGLILVTGPTGSGKTTTLYAILNRLNQPEKKIITIEDPIEYSLPRIIQIQINPTIELTFARILRSTLRQDPDIIMIGEMRDEETARIGLRAAMTGHLVFSTLHTNNAISSAMRLIDMGVEGYLVASSLKAILAQRLVRRICNSCSKKYEPDANEKEWLTALFGKYDNSWVFAKGKGCSRCNKTGYKGRIAVHELLEIDSELSDHLKSQDNLAFTKAARQQKNFMPLSHSAFNLALKGITGLEEVFRITEEISEQPENLIKTAEG